VAEGWSATAANAHLTTDGGTYVWIKLHIGAPGSAGTANAAANTTRKQVTWGTPSGGVMSNTDAPSWTTVAAVEDYTHFSAWTASTNGTFGFSGTVTANAVAVGDDFTAAIAALTATVTLAS